jgi:hypothetical protein
MPLPLTLLSFNRADLSDLTTRVTISETGAEANGTSYTCIVSPDGRYVPFESAASNLVPGDTNGKQDVS